MELADTNLEKQQYNGFERFMFLMLPILFVIALLLVLLTLIDNEIRNRVLQYGQSIPVLKEVIPEPKFNEMMLDDEEIRSMKLREKIEELENELAIVRTELADVNATNETELQTVAELQAENERLNLQMEEVLLDEEQYTARINELAGMFSKMTPSKAAPIIESMTLDDIVLLFAMMRTDDRASIMEKMDPKTAADATIKLKDIVSVKDQQIAALQSQVDEALAIAALSNATTLDDGQLSGTFTSMNAKSAGELLIKMLGNGTSDVLRILTTVSNNARSLILTEMSKIDEAATADVVAKLME